LKKYHALTNRVNRILIAHPYVHPAGGGNAVAAWAIQALARDYDVTLALLGPIDVTGLNRSFGTSLSESGFTVCMAPEKYQRVVRYMPTQGALLESNLTGSRALEFDSAGRFAALLSTRKDTDFGRVGAQPSADCDRPLRPLRVKRERAGKTFPLFHVP
jgi:hypothetical protein